MADCQHWHCLPSAALRPFIDRYWGWDIPVATTLPLLMPGTGSECFFHYRQPPLLQNGTTLPSSYLVCPRQQMARFLPSSSLGFIAIRFKNGQLRLFTRHAFTELNDQLPSLNLIWGSLADELYEQLLGADNRHIQINHIEQFLLMQLSRHHHSHENALDHLIEQIYYAPNQKMEYLATCTGQSLRHIERGFKQAFALTPKRFARLARLHHTLRQISLQPEQPLLDIALERGFSDQSHFIHDLQALIGLKPRALLPLLRQQPHYYNPPSRKPE
jgi:AraC-like DNA-binding protein